MYILCKESPSAKKTPYIYEMDSRGTLCKIPPSTKETPLAHETNTRCICPVCGEITTFSIFHLATEKIAYTNGHVISNNPDLLMFEKKLIMSDRTLKGATT